jgi:pyridoxal phosphate enzyme (YggS family)
MSPPSDDIHQNLATIRERIGAAAVAAGRRPEDIRLIAVSKYMPAEYVLQAMAAGQHCFGESTIQDARNKQALIDDPANEWHFIGHLQTNKAKYVPGHFNWLHTLDSLGLAGRLSGQAVKSACILNVLLQVNIASDPDKFGLNPAKVFRFVDDLLQSNLAGIRLQGLMTIGRRDAAPDERRRDFTALRELGTACAQRFGTALFSELSMGMSGDFETAILEGATMVRIGSSIFGRRPAPAK